MLIYLFSLLDQNEPSKLRNSSTPKRNEKENHATSFLEYIKTYITNQIYDRLIETLS